MTTPNVDATEFLAGETLIYARPVGRGKKRLVEDRTATYRAGVGVILETTSGESLGVSTAATTDHAARHLHAQLTRRPLSGEVTATRVGGRRR